MKARCLVNILFVGGILCAAILALAAGGKMKITSPAFQEGGNIPQKFTCDGANLSPALRLEGITADAKSLVLIVDDPDALGGLFTHWLIWNVDPKISEISEGSAPKGAQGMNDFGKSGYAGPCPPSGTHRYVFKLFALDQPLNLSAGARRADLDKQMQGHVIAQGQLMGRYARSR